MDCACSQHNTTEKMNVRKILLAASSAKREEKKVKLLKIIGLKIAHFCLRGRERENE